ncbi:hypothetical protein CPZ25_019995 [Eubacterium maltosivorans]|uniref:Uncharacterized protein n=1 Tax=Eubacterium maltosivorans TaxID=2041044 RepID=A0A4P9CCW0_EUBML|nr:hypothetical protein CPZ25_019995 [Eubacterium maltosivorans]
MIKDTTESLGAFPYFKIILPVKLLAINSVIITGIIIMPVAEIPMIPLQKSIPDSERAFYKYT